jgi:hypothetical protein
VIIANIGGVVKSRLPIAIQGGESLGTHPLSYTRRAEEAFETIDFNNPSPVSPHQSMLTCGFLQPPGHRPNGLSGEGQSPLTVLRAVT